MSAPIGDERRTARMRKGNTVIQGKRFILWLFGVMIVVSILFLLGTAKLSHGKADICRGYYDPQQQAACAATATAGPPPDLIQYH